MAVTPVAAQAGNSEQPTAPLASEPEQAVGKATTGPFVGLLPQGMVQLVGITKYPPTKRSRWFQPDGSAAELEPFFAPKRTFQSRGHKALSFLVRSQSLPGCVALAGLGNIQHQGWEGEEVADASEEASPTAGFSRPRYRRHSPRSTCGLASAWAHGKRC